MSTDPSNVSAPTSRPPPPKPSAGPPLADTVVRPFTSQGATFRGSLQPLTHAFAPQRSSSDQSSVERGLPVDPSNTRLGQYISSSARTSYTRVDVDSLPAPVYPPLPPLPTAFAMQDVPAALDAPSLHPITTTTMTPDAPTNGGQNPMMEPPIPQTPQVSLTFLLVSGHRKTQSFAPETTVGRVKELVWKAWPGRDADWQDERPPAPSYLRILYLGKILQDDETLLRAGFPTLLPSASNATPTIVHLSIRPCALPSDDPALSKKKRLSVAIARRISSAGVAVGVGVGIGDGVRSIVDESADGTRRAGCCTGCTIC